MPPSQDQFSKRLFEECLHLRKMNRHQARRGGCHCRAAGIARPPVLGVDLLQNPFDIRFDEEPAAHVLRLFLTPDHFRMREAGKFEHQRLLREGIKLLDAHQVDIVDAAFLAFLEQVEIDLARAHHDPADLVVGDQLAFRAEVCTPVIPQDAVERRVGGRARRSARPLSCDAEATSVSSGPAVCGYRGAAAGAGCGNSSTGRRTVRDLHVVLGAELKKPFKPRGGVFRSPGPRSHAAGGRRDRTMRSHLRSPDEMN